MAQLVENLPALQDRMCAKSFQLRLTLCDPMDGSPSGSSVHGVAKRRTQLSGQYTHKLLIVLLFQNNKRKIHSHTH